MKIYSATDIHEDYQRLEQFYEFAHRNDPDMIFVLGNLADSMFYDKQGLEEYNRLRQVFQNLAMNELEQRKKHRDINIPLYEIPEIMPVIAEEVLYYEPYPKHLKELAARYLYYIDDYFPASYRRKYSIIANLSKDPDKTLVLPGNYDSSLESILTDQDMHMKTKEIQGLRVSGYGSAGYTGQDLSKFGLPLVPSKIPAELTVKYKVSLDEDGVYSEPYEFLRQEQPDIALLHMPVYGHCDVAQSYQDPSKLEHTGDPMLLKYAKDSKTKLFFSGHIHESKGVETMLTDNGPAFFINSGNLGSGEFAEIILDDNTKEFIECNFYKIINPNVITKSKTFYYDRELLSIRKIDHIPHIMIAPKDLAKDLKEKDEDKVKSILLRSF